MSEETVNDSNTEAEESNLEALKAQATLMGLTFHPSIGAAKLSEKIAETIANIDDGSGSEEAPEGETENAMRSRLKKEAIKLIRVRVACMNPNKREWSSEIFSTGNMLTGTITKAVPFDVDWYVPQIILDMIQQRKCQVFTTVKEGGKKVRRGKLIKEFSVEILRPLSEAELKDLAQRQAMANGTAE